MAAKSRVKEGVTPSGLQYRAVKNKNRTVVEVPKSFSARQNVTGSEKLEAAQTTRGRVRNHKTGKVTSYDSRTKWSDDRRGEGGSSNVTKKLKGNPKLKKARGDMVDNASPGMRQFANREQQRQKRYAKEMKK